MKLTNTSLFFVCCLGSPRKLRHFAAASGFQKMAGWPRCLVGCYPCMEKIAWMLYDVVWINGIVWKCME